MPSLLRALSFALAVVLTASIGSADSAAPASPAPPPSLIGMTREQVIAARGKPSGERGRDGGLVMVYPDGTKVELRAGQVVAVSGGPEAEIVGADGTRYVPGADGNIQRPVVMSDPSTAPVLTPTDSAETASTPPSSASTPAVSPPEVPAAAPAEPDDLDGDTPPGATIALPPGSPAAALEKHVEEMEDPEDEPPASLAKTLLAFGLDVVFRFGAAVLVLRLALHFVGVPFFWPDLLKVAVLYLAVREVMHGLGGLGGWWEFIPLFKLDDVTSFIVLACSLTWFKIAGSGLTALKIAAMTKAVIVGLMLAVGLAITFGLSAMQ